MNRGTAEQEQTGVTMPSPAAITFPAPRRWPDSSGRVHSCETKVWMMPMANTMPVSSGKTVGVS